MALEHALLVALQRAAGQRGSTWRRRFGRSIGFFWTATHQQIYRVLARMDADGWVEVSEVAQDGRPDKKVYAVSRGRGARARRLARRAHRRPGPLRSELAVKLRGASYGDRAAVLDVVRATPAPTTPPGSTTTGSCEQRDYPAPRAPSTGADLDQYLVLRGGIRLEEFWVDWLTEYLEAHAR